MPVNRNSEFVRVARWVGFGQCRRFPALMLGLVLLLSAPVGWAEQVLHSLKSPLQVQLQTSVNGATASVGQPFQASLAASVRYHQWTLPAGTQFAGHIARVVHSRHFGRPGAVLLQTDNAVLPGGDVFKFDAAHYTPRRNVLRDVDAETFPQSVVHQSAYSVASAGVTVPLYYAAGVSAGPALVIGQGVRILAGALVGLVRPKFRQEPVPRQLALGGLDGSGIPRVVHFIGTYPDPNYGVGATVKLYLPPQGLQDLLQTGKNPASASSASR